MVSIDNLAIIELNEENITSEWDGLIGCIKASTFIALDFEFSGLGKRKNIKAQIIDDRYKHLCETASKYSILSIGISCFQIKPNDSSNNEIKIASQTYELLTLCVDEFMVDSDSLKFLLQHGFDMNSCITKGIKYYKGNDRKNESNEHIRRLFMNISKFKLPIVLHNGFIDLIFLYQNFYASLPSSHMKFSADLSELFSSGVYDTKYIAEFHAKMPISYLEYAFYKLHYENSQNKLKNKPFLSVEFVVNSIPSSLNHDTLDSEVGKMKEYLKLDERICETYSKHGYCNQINTTCKSIHNTKLFIKIEHSKHQLKSNKKLKLSGHSDSTTSSSISEKELIESHGTKSKAHQAGIDSFMTGYLFINFALKYGFVTKSDKDEYEMSKCDSWLFNVYLTAKDYPFIINKSSFINTSAQHQEKFSNFK